MGGKAYGNYVFTNISSAPCTLSGFPTFVLLNKAGQIMRGVKVTYTTNSVSGDTEEAIDNPKPSVVPDERQLDFPSILTQVNMLLSTFLCS